MASYLDVIFFSAIGGVISLLGGLLLISSRKKANSFATLATPFAAGALIAAAFLDLLPEAAHIGNIETGLMGALIGILLFFFLEKFLHFFHHHHEEDGVSRNSNASLIIIGDTIHNFIDGIAIAAGFLVSVPTGIIVTIAVAAHEIPQEIGDFGLLLKKGLSRKKVIVVNILSALATVVAALTFFSIGEAALGNLDLILGLTAGFFIYIAVSDIIPSIHHAESKKIAGPQSLLLVTGVILVGFATTTLHNYIEAGEAGHSDHSHSEDIHDQEEHHDEASVHEEAHHEEDER